MDEYPYEHLVRENGARSRADPEFELFDAMPETWRNNHYFDVFVEYAKAGENDTMCAITAINRSTDRTAPLVIMPQAFFRNTWSWGYPGTQERPTMREVCGVVWCSAAICLQHDMV